MDIIIDMEDQNWNAVAGRTPTDEEILNEEDHTMKIDWIRVYKPVPNDGSAPVVPVKENRERKIEFTNKNTFVPNGTDLLEFKVGETITINLDYATQINDDIEEDLNYIATHVRQLDEKGVQVAASPFQTFVNDNDPNADTTSYQFTLPTHFDAEKNNPIPTSENLPEGHKLQLLIYMHYDGSPTIFEGSATIDANTDFKLVANSTLSVNKVALSPVQIYPNPAKNVFYLKGIDFNSWEIFDLNGKKIISGTEPKVITKALSNGIYIVKVDNKYNLKLIKE